MKKKIITALLAFSCFISGLLLLFMEKPNLQTYTSLEEIDDIIFEELESFNIAKDQIRIRTVEIDTSFSRKTFTFALHPSYSKTMIHQHIHEKLFDYEIDSPAKLNIKDDELSIYIYSNNTVFRTIHILTDKSAGDVNDQENNN